MAKLFLTKGKQHVSTTSQLNMLYRLIGFIVLLGSIYILIYPEITGRKVLYRGQLDLQIFSIPGIFLSFIAFMERKVKIDISSEEITVSYGIPLLTFYKKTYMFSFFYKILLSVDATPPSASATGEFHNFVIPWYHVAIISNKTKLGTELLIAKSTKPEESRNIAEVFSECTKIPLEIGPHYPA